jgi:hypothetical protein
VGARGADARLLALAAAFVEAAPQDTR